MFCHEETDERKKTTKVIEIVPYDYGVDDFDFTLNMSSIPIFSAIFVVAVTVVDIK